MSRVVVREALREPLDVLGGQSRGGVAAAQRALTGS